MFNKFALDLRKCVIDQVKHYISMFYDHMLSSTPTTQKNYSHLK